MCCDIIETMPWQCDEKDCPAPGGWHKTNYWIDGDGYTADTYADGDHEEINEEDIPEHEEVKKAWDEYARWVIENGTDPLGEYYVKYTRKVKERWSIKVNRSLLGYLLIDMRRGRKPVSVAKKYIPPYLAEYLELQSDRKRAVLNITREELAAAGIKVNRWHTFTIEREIERPAKKVAAELRRIARRNLKRT